MTVKERLHQMIDALSPAELAEAERRLSTLQPRGPAHTLDNAPADDEPYTEEERAAVKEAWEDVHAGRVRSLADVKRELGL